MFCVSDRHASDNGAQGENDWRQWPLSQYKTEDWPTKNSVVNSLRIPLVYYNI